MNSLTTEKVEIVLNGEARQVPAGLSLLDLLAYLELDPARVAVELDRRIVRQPEWAGTPIRNGSSLEIVHFVGGG
jgi:thiamine biosynthesis protein ThiS